MEEVRFESSLSGWIRQAPCRVCHGSNVFADNSDEGTKHLPRSYSRSVPELRASHALSQLSLRTIICGTEKWCPYLYRGERAGSKSLIQSSRTGGDADEFQGLSRGGKEVGKDAGRRPGGSNWLPSSRDILSRERMRLASAFLGKQNTQHRNPRLWRKPYPGYWGPHCLLGRGTGKRQEADFAAG